MRSGTRAPYALVLAVLCVASHFEGACCRGVGGRGGGGSARGAGRPGSGGRGGWGRGGRPFLGGAGVGAAVGMGARGSHGHRHSSADGVRGRSAWRMAGAGAALATAALIW
jgi:translation initiation factor IF-2